MGGFGDEVMVRARLALSTEVSIDDAWAYRRWVTHLCDIADMIACWGAEMPYKDESQNIVVPEVSRAFLRLREMCPLEYWKFDFRTWSDFVIWCRTHPRYDPEGMPIQYKPGAHDHPAA